MSSRPLPGRLLPALAVAAALTVAACTSGGTTTTAGVGSPEPAVSASAPAPAPASAASSDAGAGAGPCAPSTEPGTVQAAMTGNAFSPSTIQAKVGDVIAWTNGDGVPHTATYKDDPTCTTDRLGKDEVGAMTFSAPGTYAFFCQIHTDMTGTIEVTS